MDPGIVELRLTLATSPPRDLVVRAPVGTTLAELTAQVLDGPGRSTGDEPGRRWSVDGRPVPGDQLVGHPPLLDGCLLGPLSTGRRPASSAGESSAGASSAGEVGPGSDQGRYELHVLAGPRIGHRLPVGPAPVQVGRGPGNDLDLHDPDVSRRHLALTPPGRGGRPASVRDLLSSNGSQVITPGTGDRRRAEPVADLDDLDDEHDLDDEVVQLGSSRIALRQTAPPADLRPDGLGHLLVHRAPYPAPEPVETVVPVPAPPTPRPTPQPSWPMIVLPLLFAVPAAWWWHQPLLLLMGLLSPATALTQMAVDRRRGRRELRRAEADHRRALAQADTEVREALRQAAHRAWQCHPDPAAVAAVAARRDLRLWRHDGRAPLPVRLGTADLDAPVVRRGPAGPEPVTLVDAPVTLDLSRTAVLGICGPPGPARALARCLVGQLAVACSPADLAITVVGGGADPAREWGWTAWLPHACDRLPAPDAARPAPADEDPGGPRHLVVLDAPARNHPELLPLLERPGRAILVWVAGSRALLPRQCQVVVTVAEPEPMAPGGHSDTGEPDGTVEQPGAAVQHCRLELPGPQWARRLARDLAPLRDAGTRDASVGLPDRVRLLGLVAGGADPAVVARRWLAPPGPGLAVPLGSTEGGVWCPDLVGDGPHALVAGTTGAGKSELLVSLVASLALHHSPQALSLLLVDYKGGTAFGRLVELPHVTGVVTDLDGANAHRVLSSLTAELRRREAALAGARGTDETELRLRELGRLVVVVDEFRVLAQEQPDVLSALVRVATVGRGLGVHLVLATQRPAGVVSGEMRANVALRVALRVRDRTDSDDVVEAPHAARLGADHPGRAWVRDASGALFAVQTAHLPAVADSPAPGQPQHLQWAPMSVDPVMPSRSRHGLPSRTADPPQDDLGQVVLAVRAAANLLGCSPSRAAWLPALPQRLSWAQLAASVAPDPEQGDPEQGDPDPGPGSVVLPFALADLPHRQLQTAMTWRLPQDGHLAVSGGPGSGRSTTARTIAFAAVEAGLEVHVIEGAPVPGPPLSEWVTGTVVAAADVDRTVRLVRRLARRSTGGTDRARPIVLVVDGWEALEQTWSRAGWAQGADEVQALARDGFAAGLRLVVTGGRALLSGPLAALLSERLLLRTVDPATTLLAGVPTARMPSPWPDGRVLQVRGSEVTSAQVALLDPHPPRSAAWAAPAVTGARLQPLPHSVGREALPRARHEGALWLGLGGDTAGPVSLPAGAGCLVTGGPGSGRTTALATLARALVETGRRVLVVTATPENPWWPTGSTVRSVARRGGRLLAPVAPDHDEVLLLDDGWLSVAGLDDLGLGHLGAPEDPSGPGGPEPLATTAADRLRVVAAVTGAELTVAYRGLVAALRDGGVALALGARSWAVDPLAPAGPGSPPGRAVLVQGQRRTPVQVALPRPVPAAGGLRAAARLSAVRTPA